MGEILQRQTDAAPVFLAMTDSYELSANDR